MTGVVEGHSSRLEEVEKEHTTRTRELREQNLELAARVETLKDSLDGEGGRAKAASRLRLTPTRTLFRRREPPRAG